jgi:hypothetical protein
MGMMARASKGSTRRAATSIERPRFSRKRVPADRLNLTDQERASLPDPNWVTEDDADAIVARRRQKEPTVSFEEVLRENGIRLAR